MGIDTSLRKNKKVILYYSTLIFVISFIIVTVVLLIIDINGDAIIKSNVIKNQQNYVNVEREVISNKIDNSISDLLYITDNFEISENAGKSNDDIAKDWIAFSNRKKIYDQIRFLDIDGNEIIRVNYSDDGAYQTLASDLQNKMTRYYFYEALSLKKGNVALSKLDLNIENDVLENPIKPMLRLSTPYFSEDGTLKGVIILNYKATDLLDQVSNVASTAESNTFIVSGDGYWILNTLDGEKEWAFMYDDKSSISFENEFVQEWNKIKSLKKGTFFMKSGVFNYTNFLDADTFNTSIYDDILTVSEDWYIISYIEPDSAIGEIFTLNLYENLILTVTRHSMTFLVLLILSIFFGVMLTLNKIEKVKTKYYSEYDVMTGVFNRRAGFEKLNNFYRNVLKNNSEMSICFIDINGLKEVNDNLGHEDGDELITTIIKVIKDNIRENDFVARLGGDEFLITFDGIGSDDAEAIWLRILADFEDINVNENRPYILSASHGIETLTFNTNEIIDSVVNSADEKMYAEKRIMKEKLRIIKIK